MPAVGPLHAPDELFHADEATLQVTQSKICFQSEIPFLEGISEGETILDSTPNFFFGYLNISISDVED